MNWDIEQGHWKRSICFFWIPNTEKKKNGVSQNNLMQLCWEYICITSRLNCFSFRPFSSNWGFIYEGMSWILDFILFSSFWLGFVCDRCLEFKVSFIFSSLSRVHPWWHSPECSQDSQKKKSLYHWFIHHWLIPNSWGWWLLIQSKPTLISSTRESVPTSWKSSLPASKQSAVHYYTKNASKLQNKNHNICNTNDFRWTSTCLVIEKMAD